MGETMYSMSTNWAVSSQKLAYNIEFRRVDKIKCNEISSLMGFVLLLWSPLWLWVKELQRSTYESELNEVYISFSRFLFNAIILNWGTVLYIWRRIFQTYCSSDERKSPFDANEPFAFALPICAHQLNVDTAKGAGSGEIGSGYGHIIVHHCTHRQAEESWWEENK